MAEDVGKVPLPEIDVGVAVDVGHPGALGAHVVEREGIEETKVVASSPHLKLGGFHEEGFRFFVGCFVGFDQVVIKSLFVHSLL